MTCQDTSWYGTYKVSPWKQAGYALPEFYVIAYGFDDCERRLFFSVLYTVPGALPLISVLISAIYCNFKAWTERMIYKTLHCIDLPQNSRVIFTVIV